MISWSIRYAQGITVVVLAFNRLTAVVLPARYKTVTFSRLFFVSISLAISQIWTSRVGLVIHCVQLIPPACVGAALALTTYYYDYNDQGGVYVQVRLFSVRASELSLIFSLPITTFAESFSLLQALSRQFS